MVTKLKLIFSTIVFLVLLALGHELVSEVALGAVAQRGSHNYDALLVLPPTYPPRQWLAAFIVEHEGRLPFQLGRMIGSTATVLQGVMEIGDGLRRVQVGVLIFGETGGLGGAVAVSGVVEGVHGAATAVQGLRGILEVGLYMAAKGGGGEKLQNHSNYTTNQNKIMEKLGLSKREFNKAIHGIKSQVEESRHAI